MNFTAQKHAIKTLEQGGSRLCRSIDSRAVFTETEPSRELIAYLKDNCLQSEDELKSGRGSRKSLLGHAQTTLDSLLKSNQLDRVALADCQPKVQRFWHLLKKEKKCCRPI